MVWWRREHSRQFKAPFFVLAIYHQTTSRLSLNSGSFLLVGKMTIVDGFAGRCVLGSTERGGIRFMELRFASIFNLVGGITLAISRLRGTLSSRYVFSNSSVSNFIHVSRSSVCLRPSLSS